MTFGQLYDNICRLVYGDITASPVPQEEEITIQNLILYRHRFVQMGQKLWLQTVPVAVTFQSGVYDYTLDEDFLDMIKIEYNPSGDGITFEELNIEYQISDLTFDGTNNPFYELSFSKAEYDKIFNTDINGRFIVRKLFSSGNVYDANYSTPVSVYLSWAIIFYVVGDLFLKRDDKFQSNVYYQLAEEALFNVEREDFEKRQRRHVIF